MHIGILYTVGTIAAVYFVSWAAYKLFGINICGADWSSNKPMENDNVKPRKPQDYL